jgi:phospholipid transport system substrate-binding protein
MLFRRDILRRFLMLALVIGAGAPARAAGADQIAQAASFMQQTGQRMVAVVNSAASDEQKRPELQQIVDSSVDVNEIGRFCLGRYQRTATPQQLQDYLRLFHVVLMNSITSKVGEYRGVQFSMTRSSLRDGNVSVGTLVTRPNNAPANVQWIISFTSGSPKIVDVLAEGTSLRLTQRSDYASYLARNNGDIGALIQAMRRQAGG